jgi:hypothetical protein
MSLTLLVICLVLLAIPLAWVALKLLFRLPVLKHFAQGAVALTAAGLAGLALFTAWDLTSYRALLEETPVAELTFYRQAPQQYRVELRVEDESREFLLYGDQWQLDARMIKWQSVVARLGVDPLFRLERVSGRYASVVDELNRPRSVYALGESRGLDLWHWLRQSEQLTRLADADYGSAAYLPMAHGARFQVSMTSFGLVARPLNAEAAAAVAHWAP